MVCRVRQVIEGQKSELEQSWFAKKKMSKSLLKLIKRNINRFKQYAQKRGFPYQRMIKSLIDQYAEKVFVGK